jgi:hypothetical protein
MSYSRKNHVLVFGRGLHIATNEAADIRDLGDGVFKINGYTVTKDSCTCPGRSKNQIRAAAERAGQDVGEYPGETCKHQEAVALVSDSEAAFKAMALTPEEIDGTMMDGWNHQARIAERQAQGLPEIVAVGPGIAPVKVRVLLVTAGDGKRIKLDTAKGFRYTDKWFYRLNGQSVKDAKAALAKLYGDGFTISEETVSSDFAEKITAVPAS